MKRITTYGAGQIDDLLPGEDDRQLLPPRAAIDQITLIILCGRLGLYRH
jgi:hypothetical protein